MFLCLCALARAGEPIRLRWAFLKPSIDEKVLEVIDFRVAPRVTEGDRLQIYIETDSAVFVYLFLFDSSKNLHLLFPGRIELYARQAMAPGTYFLPGEAEWFVMDAVKGNEDFYLLVSRQRLRRIEELAKRYLRNPADQRLKSDLLIEIINTRNANSKIAGTIEKGVPIAGSIRGPGPEAEFEATSVETDTFYGRVLRLSHE